ncbi:hypothetical protein RF11_13515 [Thelohanellus kitauei]|uniref:Uncharacterized protein n=1 Tax=Thelohanellus kitauei TaxID=669202 RepID=A0A0C2MGU3_THEKT|nr:hypothetical protein RF11_13515 [Thelohanellus kitauei]
MNQKEMIIQTKKHNHGPDPSKVDARRVISHVKENARTSKISIQRIVASNVIGVNQSTASGLPSLPSFIVLFNRHVEMRTLLCIVRIRLHQLLFLLSIRLAIGVNNFYCMTVVQMKIDYSYFQQKQHENHKIK